MREISYLYNIKASISIVSFVFIPKLYKYVKCLCNSNYINFSKLEKKIMFIH